MAIFGRVLTAPRVHRVVQRAFSSANLTGITAHAAGMAVGDGLPLLRSGGTRSSLATIGQTGGRLLVGY